MKKIKLFPTKIELQRRKLMTILIEKIENNTITPEELPILRGLIELNQESLSSRVKQFFPKIGSLVLQKITVHHQRMLLKTDRFDSIHHKYSKREIYKAINFLTIVDCIAYVDLSNEEVIKKLETDLKSMIDNVNHSIVAEFIEAKKI